MGVSSKLSSGASIANAFSKKNTITGAVIATGVTATALHVATLTSTKIVASQGIGGAIALTSTVVKASIFSKVIVGVTCLGITAVAAKLTYNHFNKNK